MYVLLYLRILSYYVCMGTRTFDHRTFDHRAIDHRAIDHYLNKVDHRAIDHHYK